MEPELLDATLHSHGLRATPQRRLILEALEDLGHATPEQVVEYLRDYPGPRVNLSTVYRTLELFQDLGLVNHAHLSHGAPTYQVASHADHFHLVCRNCDRLIETDLGPARELAAAIERNHGFRADLAHLSLHGLCADCLAGKAAAGEGNPHTERLHRHD
jgi:Fur family ferric uptake transcriptional regulator